MPYRHLPYATINDPRRREVFHNTDMLFHDIYGMFKLPEAVDGEGGGGNFSIALLLLCIVDGLGSIGKISTKGFVKEFVKSE